MSVIDLSLLPAPDVVESLDFEDILAERKARLVELTAETDRPALEAALALESEPITKLLQENAYRELALRQRINEAARAVMLAYAGSADLDQIGANYGVPRLLIDAGDSDAVPPVAPTWEADSDYRRRILLSLEGYTTAGSAESYVFHALSADGAVRDAAAVSPAPGQVTVYVLSREGDGTASEQTLSAVAAAVNAEHVRPMTDEVTVLSAAVVTYTIEADLLVANGPDATVIRDAATAAATQYAEESRRLGLDVSLSGIYRALHQPGVLRVDLTAPAGNIVIADGQTGYCTDIAITAGDGSE